MILTSKHVQIPKLRVHKGMTLKDVIIDRSHKHTFEGVEATYYSFKAYLDNNERLNEIYGYINTSNDNIFGSMYASKLLDDFMDEFKNHLKTYNKVYSLNEYIDENLDVLTQT